MNTVVVSRPSHWGNPYPVVAGDRQSAVNCFRKELEWHLTGASLVDGETLRQKLIALRGKNLACWCPIYDEKGLRVPCHADILLELANKNSELV